MPANQIMLNINLANAEVEHDFYFLAYFSFFLSKNDIFIII
jgi:hypothetical protein